MESKVIPEIDESIRSLGATAIRVLYRSTSSRNGASIDVSGMVFIPAGEPPPTGWPVLAFAHGTTGIDYECGPSLYPNLLGAAPQIAGFLKAGFAVAAADYEGLGAPGVHLYLDAKAEAWNVIDSVRALRHLRPGSISERWLVYGGSQGGGAAWAVAEQAATYAPDLQLLGAVSVVPAADVSGMAQMAFDGSMNPLQMGAYIAILTAQSRAHPDLDLDQHRRGSAATNWQALTSCSRGQERAEALQKVTLEEVKPASVEAAARMRELLSRIALPQQRTQAPLLVIYVGKDEFIETEWTRAAITRACAMGSKIEVVFQADKSHGTFDAGMVPEWMARRLAQEPFKGTCE
ncbi:pimeloyl-ACP methyl ester carboxylesterase [Povalibacter uvarum]|uniref:Pimeloyl-ACP methyl ester carboxylesterase n=1 Tax=Povalibacter uvarum TaxID=732238 RepID=A0A841HFN4_9GAMM|nr:lipase family protein [Povalibacter uvarum]MBB6091687.1 pimeloyl-ACP methyl ester carboxylesterase [Povalibacter uvarum]